MHCAVFSDYLLFKKAERLYVYIEPLKVSNLSFTYGVSNPVSGWFGQLIRKAGANRRQIDMQIKQSLIMPRQRSFNFFGRYPPKSMPPPEPGIVIIPEYQI